MNAVPEIKGLELQNCKIRFFFLMSPIEKALKLNNSTVYCFSVLKFQSFFGDFTGKKLKIVGLIPSPTKPDYAFQNFICILSIRGAGILFVCLCFSLSPSECHVKDIILKGNAEPEG